MFFRLMHDHLRGLVLCIVGTVPVDDHSVDAAADHVSNLPLHLHCVIRRVSHVYVVPLSKPQQKLSKHFCGIAVVEQRVNVHFAHVVGTQISIRLIHETTRRTGVVGALSGKGSGWAKRCRRPDRARTRSRTWTRKCTQVGFRTRTTSCKTQRQGQNCSTIYTAHHSSTGK